MLHLFWDWYNAPNFMNWLTTRRHFYSTLSSSSAMSASISTTAPNGLPRRILVNRTHQLHKFCSNEISTCKYNAFSFLPRFLLEQFRRYSNVFFLIIALLQQIPDVSPTGRYTTAVPFLIILSVSAIKEIFEDLKRRRLDTTVNNFKVYVLRNRTWEITRWKYLKVGEIVKIEQDHTFPADLVILSSSEAEGMAYIETSNLDGETNLKIRQAHYLTAELLTIDHLEGESIEIECEPPSRHVNEFTGTLKYGNEKVPLAIGHLLLRGAKLKNTKWIFGAVVYTGHDARLLMNSRTAPLKRSNIDTLTNRRILFLFFTLVALATISAIGAEIYNRFLLDGVWYISGKRPANFAWNAMTFFILYNNLIPISLQVTLEVVRFFQASYINSDIKMYDPSTDTPANARTSNLNEELGQVKFLMTDKTGTLTCNIMKFKRCCINAIAYGDDESEAFSDKKLIDELDRNTPDSIAIKEFLMMMASCHTVVPEKDSDGEFNYQSSSPDEGALVRGANGQGFVFCARRPREIVVKTPTGEVAMQLLSVLEFTSDRKRMSVVIRDPNGTIKVYCKGADSVIFERLSSTINPQPLLDIYLEQLENYACKGYRTLCFAVRTLSEEEYTRWAERFKHASVSLTEREAKLAKVAEEVEHDLQLIGVSAIEDKLQDHVPCTITALLAANIRIWILTGDKRETAINIAQSSALCTKKTKLLTLDKKTYDHVLADLNELLDQARKYLHEGVEFALVINGAALHHAFTGEARRIFTELAFICHSVICCRMTPMQKAEVVEIVHEVTGEIVLAVGDGANDVAMIQAANVGVGITGEEGLQAASASDYSIGQFHFLRRLLLVHGTWNFDRSVKVILYSFYKNICLYIIELWFAFFSAFSGQTIFERWTIATFNVCFTAFPPIILGLFDKPSSSRILLKNPELYQSFQNLSFSNTRFTTWIVMSLWHSVLLFFLTYGFISHQVVWDSGKIGGWLMFGNSCYTFVVITVCLKALLECDTWTYVIVLSCIGSIILWLLFLIIYSLVWPLLPIGSDMSGMAWIMVSSSTFWLALIFIPITTLLTDFVLKGVLTNLSPTPIERIRFSEMQQGKKCTAEAGCTNNNCSTFSNGSTDRNQVRRRAFEGSEDERFIGSLMPCAAVMGVGGERAVTGSSAIIYTAQNFSTTIKLPENGKTTPVPQKKYGATDETRGADCYELMRQRVNTDQSE